VVDFYAGTCLGNWKDPERAQGKPETFESGAAFSSDNSAAFTAGDATIFCGSFVPSESSKQGVITSVGLTLVWQIGEAPSSTDQGGAVLPAEDNQLKAEPHASSVTPVTSFFKMFSPMTPLLPRAYAEDSPAPSSTTDEIVEVAGNTASEEISETIVGETTTTATSSTASTDISTTSLPALLPPEPDEHFLSVSYSTDGQTWIVIQNVSEKNWPNLTVALPSFTWDELRKVQVRVSGIPTAASSLPAVYLDGMFLEVHYESLPLIIQGGESEKATSSLVELAPGVTVETPTKKEVPIIPAPEIILFEKKEGRADIVIRYAGPLLNDPLKVFLYPAGTRAARQENGFAFSEMPDGPLLDSAQLSEGDFNEKKEARFSIIAPDASPDYGLRSSEMQPGIYSIDIAYFNGQEWLKTLPRNFEWP
jgi:hypothetical protein